jgi:hypothetical protein
MPDIDKGDGWRLYCSTVLLITGLFAGVWLLTIRRLTRRVGGTP